MNKIFLIAGRTGGPIMPVAAIAKNLQNVTPIMIGIKDGFEEKIVAPDTGWKLETLPEAKLYFLSFSKKNLYDYITEFGRMIKSIFALSYSILKSIFLLIKHKPKLIISAGSFLAVPMITAARTTNFLRITKAKIVIHQQDAIPGFSNKLTISAATIKTCVHEETKKYPKFKDCDVIPNPLDTDKFDQTYLKKIEKELKDINPELDQFFKNLDEKKPLFMIFGGGSGSRFINTWVAKNSEEILKKFNVLHLKGALQEEYPLPENSENYLKLDYLSKEQSLALQKADLVLCRAGMATITELLYLQKPSILVPLFNSHQEENVMAVEPYFKIFMHRKKEIKEWLKRIDEIYPEEFKKIEYPKPEKTKKALKQYYQEIQKLVE